MDDWLEDEKLEEELSDEETKEELEKLRKRLFSLCSNDEEVEWWKDKLFKAMDRGHFYGIVLLHSFEEDDKKKIFEAYKKWRDSRSKVSEDEVEG